MNGSPNDSQTDFDSGPYQFLALPVYRSGETVQESGIFTVVHPREKESTEVLILRGTKLPFCPTCNHALAFCLEQEAAHISEDTDFTAPKLVDCTVRRRSRKNRKTEKQKVA